MSGRLNRKPVDTNGPGDSVSSQIDLTRYVAENNMFLLSRPRLDYQLDFLHGQYDAL